MGVCIECGLEVEEEELVTDNDGQEACMDCLYTYDRELYNEITGETSEDD